MVSDCFGGGSHIASDLLCMTIKLNYNKKIYSVDEPEGIRFSLGGLRGYRWSEKGSLLKRCKGVLWCGLLAIGIASPAAKRGISPLDGTGVVISGNDGRKRADGRLWSLVKFIMSPAPNTFVITAECTSVEVSGSNGLKRAVNYERGLVKDIPPPALGPVAFVEVDGTGVVASGSNGLKRAFACAAGLAK